MGLQIRTYVNGKQRYLDLYGDENVTLDVSFAEIQDITKRNSAYTQEFKVPGTDNNSDIFNYFFEINAVPLDWTYQPVAISLSISRRSRTFCVLNTISLSIHIM